MVGEWWVGEWWVGGGLNTQEDMKQSTAQEMDCVAPVAQSVHMLKDRATLVYF